MRKRLSTPETVLATAHPKSMGRDEMNLAEFPLATLADRAPRGCKTLVFEDRIWDRGQGQHRVRRLTISASDKYGLPTAIDDEVILGLVQVSKVAGFAERWVRFSRYRLIHLLGWRDEGRSYRRLEHSLKRWLGVTLYYENAWWDKERKRWVDAHFHLLDDLVLYRRPKPRVGNSPKAGDGPLSSFTWNEIVFQSFRAGFLKQLDLELYRHLKLSAAKRMYRFLDKRFHFSSTLRFKLAVFACEHIGLSRRYDVAQLKRRLAPAVAELEQAGYLVPLPTKDRFHRLRRGEWEVVFMRVPKPRKQRRPAARSSELERRLVERGVTASTACQLVREHAEELIQAKIAVFDALRQQRDRRISQNPAGFLVQSIRDDYLPPPGFGQEVPRSNTRSRVASDAAGTVALSPRPSRILKACPRKEVSTADYLSRLSASERGELEAKAIAQARVVPADGYRRAVAEGNSERVEHYRQVILKQYIEEVVQANTAVAEGYVTQQPT
jgi:hypothetical protein